MRAPPTPQQMDGELLGDGEPCAHLVGPGDARLAEAQLHALELVAVTRRKLLVRGGSDSRPSGVYWRSSSARMSRRWTSQEMSSTSSRNKVSPWTTESRPSLSLVAPVKEPALGPKSSDLMVSPLNWPQATEGQR